MESESIEMQFRFMVLGLIGRLQAQGHPVCRMKQGVMCTNEMRPTFPSMLNS